jgi:hypothetical protein
MVFVGWFAQNRPLVSRLPIGCHPCGVGLAAHTNVASGSVWHTPIAGVGVLVLCLWGCWVLRPCPRTYLLLRHDQSRVPSLQRFLLPAFLGTVNPSDSLLAPSNFGSALYAWSLPDIGCQVGSLLFRASLSPRAVAHTPERSRARPGSRRTLSVAFAVR